MPTAFDLAITVTLVNEGFFSKDAEDPGGETYYGLSRRANADMEPWPPTRSQAIDRYRSHYWEKFRCDRMPWPLGLFYFDGVVNHDPEDNARMLQRAVRAGEDGVVGSRTLAAIGRYPIEETCAAYFANRIYFIYANLAGWQHDGRGWMVRLSRVQHAGWTTTPEDLTT